MVGVIEPVILAVLLIILGALSIRIVRPTGRAIVERFGKYHCFATPGINFILPFIDRLYPVNITEQITELEQQEVITGDNLNAMVDAQVYYKILSDEENVKKSQYNVNKVDYQIVALARTTLRNVIGSMTLKEVNSARNVINEKLGTALEKEASKWGVEIVRAELKEVTPPAAVQTTMNQIVVAENEKIAAKDFAIAQQTRADGERMATVKIAEGNAQAVQIEAAAKAYQIKLVNESAQKYFKGNAQVLKKLETVESTLKNNTKIVIPQGQQLVNVIDSIAGILPIRMEKKSEK
ncbi:MAG: SPFH domain-containing protein [archaeon]